MKKLVFALCMFFGAVVVVNAQDTTSTTSPTDPTSTSQTSTQDQGRTKIKSQDLPDAVKSSLESQEYRGWLVNAAYKMDASATGSTGNEQNSSDTQSSDSQSSDTQSSDSTNVSSTTGTSTSGSYNKEVYVVELKNGAQTKTVRFDKEGKKLDDGMEDDQK